MGIVFSFNQPGWPASLLATFARLIPNLHPSSIINQPKWYIQQAVHQIKPPVVEQILHFDMYLLTRCDHTWGLNHITKLQVHNMGSTLTNELDSETSS
jgi:hypothetical protein